MRHRLLSVGWHGLLLALLVASGCRAKPPTAVSVVNAPSVTPSPTACTAMLQVSTEPEGALLYIDDVLIGQTPIEASVSQGQHTLRLEKEGHASATVLTDAPCGQRMRVFEALRDQMAPGISLSPLPAQVSPQDGLKIVASAKDNGAIAHMTLWVDGTLVYRVPEPSLRHNLDTRTLTPGIHRIRIEARGAAGNAGEATASFELITLGNAAPAAPSGAPTGTPAAALTPQATTTPFVTETPDAMPLTIPSPTQIPTARPVQISYDQVTISTYGYQSALYSDEAKTGHPYPLLRRDQVGPP